MVALKPKVRLLPILVVLFIISYGLLTLLVVEQNRTIQSQRSMISLLLGDSMQLSSMKGQEYRRLHPKTQDSEEAPKPELAPGQSAPGKSMKNRNQAEADKATKSFKMPKGVSDTPDARRNLFKI